MKCYDPYLRYLQMGGFQGLPGPPTFPPERPHHTGAHMGNYFSSVFYIRASETLMCMGVRWGPSLNADSDPVGLGRGQDCISEEPPVDADTSDW